MAGYSGTPLPRKLGIVAGSRVALVNAPPEFDALLQTLPDEVTFMSLRGVNLDVIVLFLRNEQRLRLQLAKAARRLHSAGGPVGRLAKAALRKWAGSGDATDVTEDTIRDGALSLGLVDNKVAAIDDTWSGLRLVVRKEQRTRGPTSSTARRSSASDLVL